MLPTAVTQVRVHMPSNYHRYLLVNQWALYRSASDLFVPAGPACPTQGPRGAFTSGIAPLPRGWDLPTCFLETVGAGPSVCHAVVEVSVIWALAVEDVKSRYPPRMCLGLITGGRGLSIYFFLLPQTVCQMADLYCIRIHVSLKINHNCCGSLQQP